MVHNQDAEYSSDYSTSELIKIQLWGFAFWVTPRFVNLYSTRLYEPMSSRLVVTLAKEMPNQGVFMDIGAHYGYYSLLVAAQTKNHPVIGVEPIKENATVFKINVRTNALTQVTVKQVAISNVIGLKEIIIAHASDSSSFSPHPTGMKIGSRQVRTTMIDALTKHTRVGLIKLDVEGHELPALQGARRVIKTDRPTIVFEYHQVSQRLAGYTNGDLLRYVLTNGYNLWAVSEDRGGLAKLSLQAVRAHNQALDVFGHEGYGNIVALPNQIDRLGNASNLLRMKAGEWIPSQLISPFPIPGSITVDINQQLERLLAIGELDQTGIGVVVTQKAKFGKPATLCSVDYWWLAHELDFYKREYKRVDQEVRLFKRKWIYTLGQRIKRWLD